VGGRSRAFVLELALRCGCAVDYHVEIGKMRSQVLRRYFGSWEEAFNEATPLESA